MEKVEGMLAMQREVYTIEELCQLLKLGKHNVYAALKDGTIPCIRVGRRFIIPRARISAWLASGAVKVNPVQWPEGTTYRA